MPTRLTRRSIFLCLSVFVVRAAAAEPSFETFRRDIQPLLAKYCYDCHGNGVDKGGVQLDGFDSAASLQDHKLWLRALRNVRSGLMPPADEEQLPSAEAEKLMAWIKREAFGLDPAKPDPGRVTVRRLNRVEYRNTIRELTGVDYDTQKEFPADDTGHGFDNIGDVLTISPMLLEKYLDAAQAVITQAVPMQPRVVAETPVRGRDFAAIHVDTKVPEPPAPTSAELAAAAAPAAATPAQPGRGQGRGGRGMNAAPAPMRRPVPTPEGDALDLSYYTPATVAAKHRVEHAGHYQVVLDLRTAERYVDNQFDLNRCRVKFSSDGQVLLDQEFVREGTKKFEFTYDQKWAAGEHELKVEIIPVEPARPQIRNLRIRLNAVIVRGPTAEEHWVKPKDYAKFFPQDPPADAAGRKAYARELLQRFATKAFRRPADSAAVDRLVELAESVAAQPKSTFEAGIAQAMVAVLASPSFLFREEPAQGLARDKAAPIDEYALASRLSYFLWSSMPDEPLMRLAREGRLRANLPAQLQRMLADPRSKEFVRNFTGQWLQARDIANVSITALDVYLRDHPNPEYEQARQMFRRLQGRGQANRSPEEAEAIAKAREVFFAFARQPKPELTSDLRRAMQEETEMTFAHIVKEDRSVLELLESDYTFLNEDLAKHYGIDGVTGRAMRKVTLPPDSPRGGVLTQGTVLAVTSNPTRTSPVKRGVFILDAILGTPPAPPPPNIPSLEDVASPTELRNMSLRDTLALHAKEPLCRSCHNRMDPLGLALENFNAMGQWRTSELNQPVQPAGKLITGESFSDVRELKHTLATARRRDFYYSLSEKLLTYALGRGVEYYDVTTLDQLVHALEASGGKPSALLRGIVDSTPFQQRRLSNVSAVSDAANATPTHRLVHTPTHSETTVRE
jgi:hypothetical protein